MKSLNELFHDLIFKNELEGNEKFICRFSDPDGVRSGKSGWSFGMVQFDTQNNSQALACLRECGFTAAEINGIVKQTVDVVPFGPRLKANSGIIARYDEAQLSTCLYQAMNFYAEHNLPVVDTGAVLASADYVNQYGSMGEQFAAYMRALGRPVVARDILDFKLNHTLYGKRSPIDCRRRYYNLVELMKHKETAIKKTTKGATS